VWARTYRHIDIGPVAEMWPVVIAAGTKVVRIIGRATGRSKNVAKVLT